MSSKPGTTWGLAGTILGLLSLLMLSSCQPRSPGPAPASPPPNPSPVLAAPLPAPPLPEAPSPAPNPGAQASGQKLPSAILGRAQVYEDTPVRLLLRSGSLLVASGDESLVALSPKLEVAWNTKVGTAAPPVLSKGYLYVPGEAELLVLEADSGLIHARGLGLGYGVNVLPYPGGAVAVGLDELTFIPSGSAEVGEILPYKGGGLTALVHKDKLLIARASGGLALLDPRTGEIAAEAAGPVSPWLNVYGDVAVLAGVPEDGQSTGHLVAYRLPGLEEVWSLPLDFSPQAEPSIDASGIFVWGQGYLAECSLEGVAGPQIGGVCAPPLLSRGRLYYGLLTGHFVEARSLTLQPQAILRLPAALSAKPLAWEGELRLGLVDGSILRLDPSKF